MLVAGSVSNVRVQLLLGDSDKLILVFFGGGSSRLESSEGRFRLDDNAAAAASLRSSVGSAFCVTRCSASTGVDSSRGVGTKVEAVPGRGTLRGHN